MKKILVLSMVCCLLLTFVSAASAAGMKSGMINGMQNGLQNGMPAGGKNGMQNGMPSGAKNGMTNGMQSGMTNGTKKGLVNGELKESSSNSQSGAQAENDSFWTDDAERLQQLAQDGLLTSEQVEALTLGTVTPLDMLHSGALTQEQYDLLCVTDESSTNEK
ncbi:MAG: hypothetical protein PHI98_15030 [Eubacteriales bacterium]|nr:hypothetical protein [Eubacteriales bacterium]